MIVRAGQRFVGLDQDVDAETALEIAQMRALLIEDVERDRRAARTVMSCVALLISASSSTRSTCSATEEVERTTPAP